MKNILVPTDFSQQANYAFDFAYQMAEKSLADIHLINVIDYPGLSMAWSGGMNVIGGAEPPYDILDESFINQLLTRSKEEMKSLVRSKNDSQVAIHEIVEIGNPYFVLAEKIREANINLVVMGSKGASGFDEMLVGSNTEKIVRHAKCPVITIKEKRDYSKIRKIAFASNFTGDQSHVVKELEKLQGIFNASLHLVKINTPNSFDNNRTILKQMNEFTREYGMKDFTLNIYNDYIEEEGIIYFAQEIEADMIALATHGRTGIMHLLSGSIAEDVVTHARRPVWTCKM